MTRLMSRLNYKHNMYLLQLLQNQMNYQRIWIITHLLQTIIFFYHTADVAVEEKPESLIFSPNKSDVEAQIQLKHKKSSERDKLLAKKRTF